MVEPKEKVLGAGGKVVELGGEGLVVLVNIVGALAGTVEAYAVLIGLVVEHGRPVGTGAALPGAWSVVGAAEDVVEPEGHHIMDGRLAGGHHNVLDGLDELLVIGLCGNAFGLDEGLAYPLVGDLLGAEGRIPAETSEHIPVGLGEDIAGEVGVLAGIGHACHSLDHLCHGGAFAVAVGVAVEALLIRGSVIDEVVRESEVLLRDLELHHHLGLAHTAEQGVEGLAGLEVDGAVLDLDEHVVGELAVEALELLDRLVGAVGAGGAVDEGAPHHDAAVGADGLSQHIGAVGVGAAIVLRTGLALGVGLHKEASEVGDSGVDLISLVLPPLAYLRVERIAALQAAEGDGAGPFDGEVCGDAVFTKDVRDLGHAGDVLGVEDQRVGVDVVEGGAVDADGGAELSILADASLRNIGRSPLPHRLAGIAALHGVVEVVPVVEDAVIVVRLLVDVHSGAGLAEDLGALQGVYAVAHSVLGAAGYDALAVFVEDMELVLGKGVVHSGLDGCKDFTVRAGVGEPKVSAVLVHWFRGTAGGEDEAGREQKRSVDAHNRLYGYWIVRFTDWRSLSADDPPTRIW